MVQSVPAGLTVKVVVPVEDCGARTVVVVGVDAENSQTPEPVAASRKASWPSDLQLVLSIATKIETSARPRVVITLKIVLSNFCAAVKPNLTCQVHRY